MIDDLFPMTGDEPSQTLSGHISRITSLYLNEITYSIHCQEVEELQSIDWKSIDMKLSDPRFERLKKVIVRVWGGVESEVVRSFLDAHLLALKKGGLLYFDVSSFSLVNRMQAKPFARINQVTGLMKAAHQLEWVDTSSRIHGTDLSTSNAESLWC